LMRARVQIHAGVPDCRFDGGAWMSGNIAFIEANTFGQIFFLQHCKGGFLHKHAELPNHNKPARSQVPRQLVVPRFRSGPPGFVTPPLPPRLLSLCSRRAASAVMATGPMSAGMVPISLFSDSYKASHYLQYPDCQQMVAVRLDHRPQLLPSNCTAKSQS
jgi:hypothetical protein